MDLVTHFAKSYGYDIVFTIVDRFFKYVKFLPYSTYSITIDLT